MPKVLAAALVMSLLSPPGVAPPPRRASCPEIVQGPPCQMYWLADAVFVGYVTGAVGVGWAQGLTGWSPYTKLTARLNVEEVFRGDLGSEVTFEMDDCPYVFKEGERYLVYAKRDRDGKLYQRAGYTRTRPLSEAGEDLAYIRGLSQAGAGGRIYGVVRREAGDYRLRAGGAAGVEWRPRGAAAGAPGVKVVAEGKAQSYEAKTDDGGRFEFTGLPAGEYGLRADGPAGHGGEGAKISLPDRSCAPADIYLTPRGEIHGRVVSALGRPVKDARVVLFSAEGVTEEGLVRLEDAPPVTAYTNLQGAYVFNRLPAGRYYVVVSVPQGEGPNSTHLRAFHPNAAGIGEAAVITLAEGQKETGADIQLPPQ